jgi:hypothetical protein
VSDGRWYLALQRLAPARANLAAQAIVEQMPPQEPRRHAGVRGGVEARRGELAADLKTPSPTRSPA